MALLAYILFLCGSIFFGFRFYGTSNDADLSVLSAHCPDYQLYCQRPHPPLTKGPLRLPYQRPSVECRTFTSQYIEDFIDTIKTELAEIPDLARLFENTFPNTLDTTIKYHNPTLPLTFVVTGDINAEWIRDSHRQLSIYTEYGSQDPKVREMLLGAIALHARYLGSNPLCNAFQPPPESRLPLQSNGQSDFVQPVYDPAQVFECKYELDSIASFFGLANDYFAATGDTSFLTNEWLATAHTLVQKIEEMSLGTFDPNNGRLRDPPYRFKRYTSSGTETMPNNGLGNPVKATGMVRSYFRPSDDTCTFLFFIPANAQISVELRRFAEYGPSVLANHATTISHRIKNAITQYGIVKHPEYGDIYAYEVDGYGSSIIMDDANIPSLLSLPNMGFVSMNDTVYQNTRRMVLSDDNPYYLTGPAFSGIGGPHIGLRNAWPMSRIVAIRTTWDLDEIVLNMKAVMTSTGNTGLIHESIDVDSNRYTRPWFSWANAEFADMVLDLKKRGLLPEVMARLKSAGLG